MHVLAKFIGTTSLGYTHGIEYVLVFDIIKTSKARILIHKVDETGVCVYDSLKDFLLNWEIKLD